MSGGIKIVEDKILFLTECMENGGGKTDIAIRLSNIVDFKGLCCDSDGARTKILLTYPEQGSIKDRTIFVQEAADLIQFILRHEDKDED